MRCPICGSPVRTSKTDNQSSPFLTMRTKVCVDPFCCWAQKTFELVSEDCKKVSSEYRREVEKLYHALNPKPEWPAETDLSDAFSPPLILDKI
jgi:hypothetical protein